SELDVPDDVVYVRQPEAAAALPVARHRHEARLERAGVVAAVHERVDRVAVRRDRSRLDRAEVVLDRARLGDPARASLHRLTVRLGRVGYGQRDVAHAVAVLRLMTRDLVLLAQRRREDEPNLSLLEHVRRAIPAKIRTPPAISSGCSVSERRTSAKKTAKNGCRFPKSAARAGPTRSIAVNQRMLVRNRGPTTA